MSEDVVMSFCEAGVALCEHDRGEAKVAVKMGIVAKTCLSRRVRRRGHVVLRGRRGTFVTFDVFQEECVSTTVVRVKLPYL